jgi:hypothetical protein
MNIEGKRETVTESGVLEKIVHTIRVISEAYQEKMQESRKAIGKTAIFAGDFEISTRDEISDNIVFARGGNFKVVRANLIKSGKANSRQPMSEKQKKLRRRKRKRK